MKVPILTLVLLCASASAKINAARRGFQQLSPILKLYGQGEHEKVLNYTTAPSLANDSVPTRAYVNPPNLDVTPLTPQYFPTRKPGRAKVRYGPFPLDPMDQHEGMINEVLINFPMPCTNCTITNMQVSLEYPNGTTANANTGLWLHHMVIINFQRKDTTCYNSYPGQRWFASGNERTPTSFSMNGRVPSGYYIAPGDVMVMAIELMNQAMYSQDAVPTIDFEWVEGLPADFYQVRPIWLDIGGCYGGSVMTPKGDEFSYASPSYTANFNGQILGIGAHLHDGGMNLEVWQDVRHQLCNSVAQYGSTPGYFDAPGTSMTMPMAPMFVSMMHISNMSVCYAPTQYNYKAGGIKNGTILQIMANYNFTERMPMLTLDGDYDEVMGISLIYAAENMTTATLNKYLTSTTPAPLDTVPPLTGMYGIGMMPSGGDDEEESSSSSSNSTTSGMGMGMGMGGMDMPTCNLMRDSPGTITLQGLNTSDESTMNTLLTAILCDTCLQAWSAPYAEYFWYGIVVVIALFAATRALTWNTHVLRKHEASKVRPDVYEMPNTMAYASSAVYRQIRRISYPQYTPVSLPAFIRIPPMGILLMIIGYFAFLFALEFTQAKTGDLQTWQFLGVRAAWLSVAQLPLIILLSAKRNLVTLVTAVTYERLNVLHRWTARGLLMTALMHFGFQWYGWAQAGVVQYELSDSCVPTGAAALSLVLWMNLSTLAPFRNMWYELFVLQHIVTFFGLIIAVAYHVPSTAPYALTYIYISAALYLVAKIYQLAVYAYQNIRPARAVLHPISDRITKITIKSPRHIKSWAPGSFVQLSIPRLGLLQSHPASITSTPRSHNGDLIFFLLRRGGFTRKLAKADMSPTRTYMALIDGPYGASQHDFAAFNTSILFAGSTGITFILPILMDIAQRAQRVNLPLKRLFLVWSLKDISLVTALQEEIARAVRDLHTVGIIAEVSIHITGSTLSPFNPFLSNPASESEPKYTSFNPADSIERHSDDETQKGNDDKARISAVRSLSNNSESGSDADTTTGRSSKSIQVVSGRPKIAGFLDTVQRNCEGEMGVAVCGPLGMSVQIRNKVAGMQGRGGVYLHVEGFAW